MKIELTTTNPAGKPVITLRIGGPDLEIIHGLLKTALAHTPKTPATNKTIQRMRAMIRCFSSEEVRSWIECEKCDGKGWG